MPNIEIKARCHDLETAKAVAERSKTQYLGSIRQMDTYFRTPHGRLKLREIPGQGAWLIPYSKTYEKSPTRSDYQLLDASDPQGVKDLFGKLLGVDSVIDKTREVFLIDNVRVHLDEVKDLGTFIEFEAVFEVDTPAVREQEVSKVEELMRAFEVSQADLLTEGYLGLLKSAQAKTTRTGGSYSISTDPKDFDVELIHAELTSSYWATGIPKELVEKSIRHSLCFAALDSSTGKQIGFARVVSDFSTFAYLGDVFVVSKHRGRGVSKLLMKAVQEHPELQGLRRFCLATRDAHDLYKQFGFEIIKQPESWMEIKKAGIYSKRDTHKVANLSSM